MSLMQLRVTPYQQRGLLQCQWGVSAAFVASSASWPSFFCNRHALRLLKRSYAIVQLHFLTIA